MSLFRILIIGFLIYFGLKMIGSLFSSGRSVIEVKGKRKAKPLDLSNKDVQDIDFKESKDSKTDK